MIAGRELAMAVLNLRGRPAEAIVDAAAAAGFDSITLRLLEPRAGDHDHLVRDARARRALRSRMDDAGIGLLDVEVVRLRPGTVVDDLEPALDAAAELGARHLLTVDEDPDEERFLVTLAALADRCAARGLVPVLEFMRFSECASFEQALRLVQQARRGGATEVAPLVDALHLARSGGTPQQVAAVADECPELFPYVQLCDAPRRPPRGGVAEIRDEAVTARLLPGDGELPLRPLLDALPPGIPVCIETPVRELAALPDPDRAAAAFRAGADLLRGGPVPASTPGAAS
ncbi:sugar phosphate isomerase/epimerase family protein [Blastococcus sp. SYSU D00820]